MERKYEEMSAKERIELLIGDLLFIDFTLASLLKRMMLVPRSTIESMGVGYRNKTFVLIYNPEFICSLLLKELEFVLLHEAMHVLLQSFSRGKDHHPKASNYASDLVINGILDDYKYQLEDIQIPKIALTFCNTIPEYDKIRVYEVVYNYIMNNVVECKARNFDLEPDFNELDAEAIESINETVRLADNNARRSPIGHCAAQLMGDPFKKNTHILNKIKGEVSSFGGHKYRSYMREHRSGVFGMKGYKKQNNNANIVLDVSGSMSEYAARIIGLVSDKSFNYRYLQIDTEVIDKGYVSGEKLLKTKIEGGGGTTVMPAFELLKKEKRHLYPTIFLTDGFTDRLALESFKKVIIVSTGIKAPIVTGKAEQIILQL